MRSRTKTLAAGLLLFFLLPLAACGSAADNPLIGDWRLSSGGDCPYERLSFTPSQMTSHRVAIGPNPPEQHTGAVSYSVEGNSVIVHGQGTGAGAMVYTFPSPDTMQPSGSDGCTYSRASGG
jgi:hypothetical protein